MGKWSGSLTLEPLEFDGDKVVFTVNRLLIEDMLTLSKYFDKEKGAMVFGGAMEVCRVAGDILPKYVTAISGMTKADGAAMTKEDFIAAAKEFYFVPLVGQLFGQLVQVSAVKADEAKN